MEHLVSVIMSVYNEKLKWIKESITSVLEQTYKNIELVIVIDNPLMDIGTLSYLEQLEKIDERVVIIKNPYNIGLAMSLNKGIEKSKGSLIARMDADDISEPSRIEEEVAVMLDRDADVVSSGKLLINENGKNISSYEHCVTGYKKIRRILPHVNCIIHPTVLIKAEQIKKVGGYRNFRQSQDYDLWLRLLLNNCRFEIIDKPLLRYRMRDDSISAKKPLLQYLTAEYQQYLYKAKVKGNDVRYLESDLDEYLKSKNAYEHINNEKFKKGLNKINRGIHGLKERKLCGLLKIIKGILAYPYMINVLYKKMLVYYLIRYVE